MAEQSERTEKATPKRREKAREKGQVPRSRELSSMAAMGGILLVFYFSGLSLFENISALTARLLTFGAGRDPAAAMQYASRETMLLVTPFLLAAATCSFAAAAAQGGFLVKSLGFDFTRINPLSGVKRLFSLAGLGQFFKSLLKFGAGGVLFYLVIKKALIILPFTAAMQVREIIGISGFLISKTVLYGFTTFLVIAVVDYLSERWQFERSIRMTKEEIRQEFRESEGDPLIKSRIKSIQRDMARRRMIQAVPKAAVVITNPTHIAVALSYKDKEMAAPRIVAKGSGFVAEKIREIARAHGVPIVEDKPLARALNKLDLGASIPEELYRAVAKILAFIYKLRRNKE